MNTLVDGATEPRSMHDLLKNSLLYRELNAEHEEMLRHKLPATAKLMQSAECPREQTRKNSEQCLSQP